MKTCYRCKQEKEDIMFDRNSQTSSGLCTYCKECRSSERKSKSWKRSLDAKSRTHKKCTGCHNVFALSEFHKTKASLDNRSSQCKHCIRLYTLAKRDRNYENRIRSRDSIKLEFINHLGGKCSSCGIVPSDAWPLACFDFHHLNDKVERISYLMSKKKGSAHTELNKCIVLCSNCHRKEHKKISSDKRNARILANDHSPIYTTNVL